MGGIVQNARVTGSRARFEWERKLRQDTTVPRYLKGFLLLVGTYMNNDGTQAIPSAPTLAAQFHLSRQRVFELFQEAEAAGWLVTEKRPGKPSVRLPAVPDPSDGSYAYPSDPSDGYQPDPSDPSDGSDPTRQTGRTGSPDPSDPSDPTDKDQGTGTRTARGTLPPDPLRPTAPKAGRSNDEPLPDQADGPGANSSPKGDPPHAEAREAVVAVVRPTCPICDAWLDPDGSCFVCRSPRSA